MNTKFSKVVCRKITTFDQLKAIYTSPLLQKQSLFNRFEWISNWYNIYWQENWQINALAYYHQDQLVAFAPFYLQKNTGLIPLTSLHPLGQGEPEQSEVASEYLDILIQDDFYPLLEDIKRQLNELRYDKLLWLGAMQNSNIAKLIDESKQHNHLARYLTDADWKVSDITPNTKKRYKRSLNQLAKIGAEFLWIEPENFDAFLDNLVALHQGRWQQLSKSGAFATNEFFQFHASFIAKHRNKIKMSAVLVEQKPIAIHYYFSDQDTLYFYQSGWDQANYANYSPSLALHVWSMENKQEANYDFMMGGTSNSYKQKFGCQQEAMININQTKSPFKVLLNKALKKLTAGWQSAQKEFD